MGSFHLGEKLGRKSTVINKSRLGVNMGRTQFKN